MSEEKEIVKDEAKGKLGRRREHRIWIFSVFLCIIVLGIALYFYYAPVFEHITLHTDEHIPIDFDPPINATVDNHPYLFNDGLLGDIPSPLKAYKDVLGKPADA